MRILNLTKRKDTEYNSYCLLLRSNQQLNSVKLYRNSYIFIQENAFENVTWKMAAILSRPQCVYNV